MSSLRLDGELTIYRAAELKSVLLEALEGAGALDIDLSEVTEIDSAGVQLLLLAQRHAQSLGRGLTLRAPSAAVLEVFELFDLAAFFGVAPAHA